MSVIPDIMKVANLQRKNIDARRTQVCHMIYVFFASSSSKVKLKSFFIVGSDTDFLNGGAFCVPPFSPPIVSVLKKAHPE